ncbi:MAG: glycosyltransferase [Anaerolineales bacterium]|nr:glycosyltransferase [Anaerolineales bacterium]
MEIAVITSSYPRYPGDGTAPFVKSICEHLAKLGHSVSVVAPYDPAVAYSESSILVRRFRYIWPAQLHIMGHARALEKDTKLRPLAFLLLPFFLLAAFLSLMHVTKEQKSRVIHAHWVLPNGLVAAWVAALRKIPFIISLHGSDIFVAQRNPIFRAVARWVFRRANGVTACSPELQQAALALGAPNDTILLAWGADPNIFHPDRRTPQKSYLSLETKPDIIIAALGRLVFKKGFDNLVSAMSIVVKEHPGAHLILGGDGLLLNELHRQAKQLGISNHVSFPGRIPWDEVPIFLANADIFVLPSIRDPHGNVDGLPTVLLEAMSSGAAIVASDIGGVQLVMNDGQNGLIVPPGDTQILAQAILSLVKNKDKRIALGRSARQSVIERYNWNAVASQIVDLLDKANLSYSEES